MKIRIFAILGLIYLIGSCASSVKESRVESPEVLYRTNCIAVLPLENRSESGMAGYKLAELVSSEIISSRAFGVMEPIEALRTTKSLKIAIPKKYDTGTAVEIGRTFGVDGVVVGVLREFSFKGPFAELNEGSPVVSFELRLINAKNGVVVWSADIKSTGSEVTDVSKDYLINFARSSVREALEPMLSTLGTRNIAMPCWKPKPPVVAVKPAQTETPDTPHKPSVTPMPSQTTKPVGTTKPPATQVKVSPAKIELVNASGNAKVVDSIGMILLTNNHDLRKMSDKKNFQNATIINYKPGFEAEAEKIMGEIRKGKTVSKPDLPPDVDIQIILGKDLL